VVILVVTADYLRGELLTQGLEEFRVKLCHDAYEALDNLQGVSLIFLDYALPAANGAALLHELASDEALMRIPIVLLADTPPEIDMEVYNIDAVLATKEATADRLKRIVRQYAE
jgi:CheY-like chemotaxis protein